MKNRSTLFKIRKIKSLISLKPGEEKNSCKNLLFFKKYKESLVKISAESELLSALVVKGLITQTGRTELRSTFLLGTGEVRG